jgi:hypothetical protein
MQLTLEGAGLAACAAVHRCAGFAVCLRLQMSEEGISGLFVNSHSYVHDICTLATVSGTVLLEGSPETAHSWFPGSLLLLSC